MDSKVFSRFLALQHNLLVIRTNFFHMPLSELCLLSIVTDLTMVVVHDMDRTELSPSTARSLVLKHDEIVHFEHILLVERHGELVTVTITCTDEGMITGTH